MFESKGGHNRIIAIEFRIRWGKGEKTEFDDIMMNVLARKEIILNKTLHQKSCLYPVMSHLWDENNMIVGLKVDIVELATKS